MVSAAGFFMWGAFFSSKPPETAEIRINGKVYQTVNLSEITTPYEITIDGKVPVTLELSSEGVRFTDSLCKDKLCIHSGLIRSGQSAACLPAGVSVSVSGNAQSGVDAVVG